jgi:hypothetical protein
MFLEPNNGLRMEEFYWMVTRFVVFELDHYSTPTLKIEHGENLIERLIKFHEDQENFEICQKILNYKQRMN